MRKILSLFTVLILYGVFAFAQTRVVTGKVTDAQGNPVPYATINIKNSNKGVAADAMGSFKIEVSPNAVLVVSSAGYEGTQVSVGSQSDIGITLKQNASLSEVIVTALGIRRSKNQLAYSAQQISGDEVNRTRNTNVGSNLSGKIAGLEIRQSNSMGGSTNIVIRGSKSLVGTNQALFVIDGVPYDNANKNDQNQRQGRGGYDYGNNASDINPDDIESITVLKGAASTALYGSRGANGVIIITTKKGRRGLGITVNSGVTVGKYDKSTFPKYQTTYGGGYGQYYEDPSGYFLYRDINGDGVDDLVVPMSEDASYGHAFDPNLMVYQWDAFDPTSQYYGKPRPWLPANNLPNTFFQTSVGLNNSVFIDGGSENGSFKLGYTRSNDIGILPNSHINKDLLNFSASHNITTRLTATASVNYAKTRGLGRYGTGYDSKNLMMTFRQWYEVNNDIKELKDAYFRTGKNVTWNWSDPSNLVPIYWDNPYWDRYENYETDSRSRYQGYASLNYKVTDWLNILGRASIDAYDEIEEERVAIGSISTTLTGQLFAADAEPSGYGRYNRNFKEANYDLLINVDKNLTTNINLKALLGGNIRQTDFSSISAKTNGGLIIPKLYSLSNTANPLLAPIEVSQKLEVDGIFAGLTLSYKNFLTLDGTIRRDKSSTLPKDNNAYYYPSVSAGFVFSNLMRNTWLSYGKLRANYAEVGASAPVASLFDTYTINAAFGSNTLTTVGTTKNNPVLVPERTKSYEIGLEASFFKSRAGFDVTYYNAKTVDQIIPVAVSRTTGYNFIYKNAGTIENKGIEASVFGTPIKTRDFSWTVNVNWSRNRNKVTEMFPGISNLLLGSFQGGVSINATLNEPYGTIRGSGFKYDPSGQKVIAAATGRYISVPDQVIGNQNPDWIGGVQNTVKYKNIALTFLVDVRQGGDVFSLDLYYGLATGLYPETAGLNDLGKPLRNTLADGGGIIREGVNEDGKPNTKRASGSNYGAYGYRFSPAQGFVYDASYVKLREVALTYSLPAKVLSKLGPIKGIDFSLIGRNLWIIHKNLPYADPEETMSSGNLQGYQGGAYPSVRNIGANIKFKF